MDNADSGPPRTDGGQAEGHDIREEEHRSMGFLSASAIGIGTMIAAGIFVLSGLAVSKVGTVAIVSFLIAALVAEVADHDVTTIGASREGVLQRLVFGAIPQGVADRIDHTAIMCRRNVGVPSRLKRLFG
jgi:hypothetical protein